MIADRQTTREVQSTIRGDVAHMSIDESATAHIMSILTDLYSDPELAILREYSTNALDSHREAGVTRPIEVTLPTGLSPFLTIRDYGVGLSVDDIHAIYCKYGASTKRETNDQVGMLGLGCKSALTYTDQFSVVAVCEATRITVSVSRDADGAGSMTVVETVATDEPNGVKIVIPAKSVNGITDKAREFFSFWPKGSVLVNGKEPERFTGLRLADDLYLHEDGQSYVVMGNVAYPVEDDELPLDLGGGGWRNNDFGVIAFLPIGSVHFTPSREALHYTPKTKAALGQVAAQVAAKVTGAIQRELDAAPSHIEAMKVVSQWHAKLPTSIRPKYEDYTYKGVSVPAEYVPAEGVVTTPAKGYGPLGGSSHQRALPAAYWPKVAWYYGYKMDSKFTASRKRKLRQHAADNDYSVETFVLVKDKPNLPWIDQSLVFAWDDVNAIKLERQVSSGGYYSTKVHITGAYKGQDHTGKWHYERTLQADAIDAKLPVFYADSQDYCAQEKIAAIAASYPGGFTVAVMPHTRVAKFCRDFPTAKSLRGPFTAAYEKFVNGITDEQKRAHALQGLIVSDNLASLDEARIDDPAIVEVIRLAKFDLTDFSKQCKLFSRAGKSFVNDKTAQNPLKKYPLLHQGGYGGFPKTDHTYIYLNAAYAAEMEG